MDVNETVVAVPHWGTTLLYPTYDSIRETKLLYPTYDSIRGTKLVYPTYDNVGDKIIIQ
jgi:hypothetical protein